MSAPRYITDSDGNRTAVILDLPTYEQLIERIEDLEDILDANAALAALAAGEEEAIPFEQAMAEIRQAEQEAQAA